MRSRYEIELVLSLVFIFISKPYTILHVAASRQRADQDMNNPDNVMLFYTRRSEPKGNEDNGSNGDDAWNREHIYAKSHGDFGTAEGPGTDVHALRAADKSVNAERSNKDFAAGGAQLSSAEARDDCPLCLETDESFEPPDEVKGDVARMIFYMVVRYNGDSDSNGVALNVVDGVGTEDGPTTANNGVIGDLASLKAWHIEDPVSDEEKHRNNIIYDIQGNRNPFIDNPQFVDIIF
jgi:endonuclease I